MDPAAPAHRSRSSPPECCLLPDDAVTPAAWHRPPTARRAPRGVERSPRRGRQPRAGDATVGSEFRAAAAGSGSARVSRTGPLPGPARRRPPPRHTARETYPAHRRPRRCPCGSHSRGRDGTRHPPRLLRLHEIDPCKGSGGEMGRRSPSTSRLAMCKVRLATTNTRRRPGPAVRGLLV